MGHRSHPGLAPDMARDVTIREIGPGSRLPAIRSTMRTADRKAWIAASAAAGIAEIEVGSCVSTDLLPAPADGVELLAFARTLPGLGVAVCASGFDAALAAVAGEVHRITMPLSASESHSLFKVRRTHDQMLEEVRQTAALIRSLPPGKRPHLQGSLATAFGCSIEGSIPQERVLHLAVALMEAGCDEVGLSDTNGHANPEQVRRMIRSMWAAVGRDQLGSIQLHNGRGQGLANAVAALDVGLKTLDASLAGLGGCTTVAGVGGNIVTEDLVFMLEAMGLRTGIDIEALFAVRQLVARALPDEPLHGMAALAGLPKGFVAATLARALA